MTGQLIYVSIRYIASCQPEEAAAPQARLVPCERHGSTLNPLYVKIRNASLPERIGKLLHV
jgi:hypothetical protein